MNNTLTIPKTLNIGFQNRSDTYTGKLAYVVYTDAKGKLRKAESWNSWCDKKIPKQEFENVPTSGFVLNRDVGGARRSYGWNARIEKVRVYDPRDFEFEISIPNLLFILQECSAIKGKGLEGEFVYSWNGSELVLLPITSQEYAESAKYNVLQTEKVTKNDMVVGCSYLTKKKEEVVYMGSYVWWGEPSTYKDKGIGKKKHVFALLGLAYKKEREYKQESSYILDDGFTKIAKKTSEHPIPQYPEIHAALIKSALVSKPVKMELVEGSVQKDKWDNWYGWAAMLREDGSLWRVNVQADRGNGYNGSGKEGVTPMYAIELVEKVSLVDGKYVAENHRQDRRGYYGYSREYYKKGLSRADMEALCKSLVMVCENGARTTLIKFVKGVDR